MKKINTTVNKKGFSLIEILISIAVAAVVLPAVIILLGFSTFTTSQGETYTEAYAIAQKEMESIYNIKKTSWGAVVSSCPVVEGIFTKCININDVDSDRKQVVVNISWDERGTTQDVNVESIIVDLN